MIEPEKPHSPESAKEAMRQALERKKAAEHEGRPGFDVDKDKGGHAHGPAAGRRQFRRKAGG